jgi:hypothetical protein
MSKRSFVVPILISIFALIAVPVSVSAVTQKSSEINLCVDWVTKEIKYSKYWEKCPARHTAMTMGSEGSSAYEIAVANGFVGTVDEWLTSLEGADGADGARGRAGSDGSGGSGAGPQGETGLQGIQGIQGDTGIQGIQGETGLQGIQGIQGIQGDTGPAGPAGSDGSGGGFYNVASLSGYGNSLSSSVFYTDFWDYYKMGFLVLDPGEYTVSLTLSAEKKTFADLSSGSTGQAYDVCSLFSAEYDPALDWGEQTFPDRVQISARDTSNPSYIRPVSTFFNLDPRYDGYPGHYADRVFNNHHSLSTIFSVVSTTKPTAVVVACTLQDNYEILSAEATVSGYISATVISGGTVDLEQLGI